MIHVVSSFLNPAPSSSVLWDWAPPGPAVMRREWCRLEEAGATEYVDPMSPRPGTYRMQVEQSTRDPAGNSWTVCRGLGGRRVRASGLGGVVGLELQAGDTVEVAVSAPERAHWVTPSGKHLVADVPEGWAVHADVQEARLASGSGRAVVTRLLAKAAKSLS